MDFGLLFHRMDRARCPTTGYVRSATGKTIREVKSLNLSFLRVKSKEHTGISHMYTYLYIYIYTYISHLYVWYVDMHFYIY